MFKRREILASALPLAGLVLFLAVGRCSPLAPSVEKTRLSVPTAEDRRRPEVPPPVAELHPFTTRVISAESGPGDGSSHVVRLSDAKLQEFVESNAVSLGLGALSPVRAVFEVDVSESQIESLDLNDYKAEIVPKPDQPGTWTLSVHDDVHPAVTEVVRTHLVAIRLYFSSAAHPSEPGHFRTEAEGETGATGETGPSGAGAAESPSAEQ